MRKILRALKKIWIFNLARRFYRATKYYNYKYIQILKWGFKSKEDTNFTYFLTESNVAYLAHTIAVVTRKDHSEIMGYFNELREDEDLKKLILSAIDESPERHFADDEVRYGRRLGWYAFARILKPKTIIETGVDKGLGSVVLCSALLRNSAEGYDGRYYGTDINPRAGYLLTGKFREKGEILFGDSIESLTNFKREVDLFINDSDHSADYEYREYLAIKSLMSKNAVILGDNSHCTGKLADFSKETNRQFLFFQETPLNHWYPGAGIGISFTDVHPNGSSESRVN